MMQLRQDLLLLIVLNFFLQISKAQISPSEDFQYLYFDKLAVALYKNVQFMTARLEQLNIDAIFGLALTEANLMSILSPKNSDILTDDMVYDILKIIEMSSASRNDEKSKLIINKNKNKMSELVKVLTEPEIWIRSIEWKKGYLKMRPIINATINNIDVKKLMFSGTPQEKESDYCLIELSNLKRQNKFCKISNNCSEMLVRNDHSRGYPLTHRLLFVQTALALNCKEISMINLPTLITNYCENIFEDLILLESLNFPLSSKDLAMEQIFLCGMEGYLEIANIHYAKLLLSWPSSIGCYSSNGFDNVKHQRYSRSTNLMDYGCDNHASGVAAATLSLLLRALVENYDGFIAPIETPEF
ncbi:uncharacterized protein LOC122850056 isoform X1 [Aphidius gifuensis]|uniref:uncharacterized protein LOC122850056 isoform X1 n=1 Tax=Aphidius gifuensis TaxID=684658 RepID=UPI001CDC2176|nr:uncharacterized protein LOC122850056 isoform X1 [Aphidius gifuensis]